LVASAATISALAPQSSTMYDTSSTARCQFTGVK
jgi:hypothetical protein